MTSKEAAEFMIELSNKQRGMWGGIGPQVANTHLTAIKLLKRAQRYCDSELFMEIQKLLDEGANEPNKPI